MVTSENNDEPITGHGKSAIIYGMNYAPELTGVGKYTGEIAQFLAQANFDITVVTTPPHYPGWKVQKGFRNRFSVANEDGVKVIRVPLLLRQRMSGIWRLLAPLSFAVTSAPVIFWQILRHRPNSVLCIEPTLFAAPIAQLAAKIVGARTVLHVQDLEVDAAFAMGHLSSKRWIRTLGFFLERLILRKFDGIVTISDRMAERIVQKGVKSDAVTVVRNWVDLAHIYPLTGHNNYRSELQYSDDDFIVLYSGNIGAKQGLDILLQAATQLEERREVKIIIAGEGPSKPLLQFKYGHLRNVRFMGFQPYSRLNEFLNLPDLHVLPQDPNAADLVLPSKLGGMLASGKPILVTAAEGTELANFVEGAALVIPPGDPNALAESIAFQAQTRSTLAFGAAASISLRLDSTTGLKQFSMSLFSQNV